MTPEKVLHIPAGLALFVLVAGAGCQNRFGASYTPAPRLATFSRTLAPYSGKTQVIKSAQLKSDAEAWGARGYLVIGYSAFATSDFRDGSSHEAQAAAEGAQVGADLVLLKIKNEGTNMVTDISPGANISPDYYVANWDRFSAVYLRKVQ